MQINPGGRLKMQDVIGRDEQIARYWEILERQGLVLTAERRIGKTHIVLKMMEECRDGFLPFYQDLERIHSVVDLIRSVYATVNESLSGSTGLKSRLAKWSTWLPERIGAVDLPTGEKHWQIFFDTVFEDLMRISDDKVILLIWDEFPLMIYNLQRRHGSLSAMELLDHLRALRSAHADKLRFLFTGSIGLHLVIRNLQKEGYANDPVNDMLTEAVSPIAHRHTCDLAAGLLVNTRAAPEQIPILASQIAEEVGGYPYYVHHIVDLLQKLTREIDHDDVTAAVNTLVYDPHDPTHLNHYVSRLSTYYDDSEQRLALIVLDVMATLMKPKQVASIAELSRVRDSAISDEQVRATLRLLAQDHYVIPHQTSDGLAYDFRWSLVKRWWRETRL